MLGGVGESIVISLASIAVDFVVKGNEKEVRENLLLPSLEAAVLFRNEKIRGHHQGLRGMSGGHRSWKSYGMKRFKIQASGEGKFISAQLTYSGEFFQGKFHDLSGGAVCCIGNCQKYTGCFEDGHASGFGILENIIDGAWHRVFEGTWRASKPWTGTHFDAEGNAMMVLRDGNLISISGSQKEGGKGAALQGASSPIADDHMPTAPATPVAVGDAVSTNVLPPCPPVTPSATLIAHKDRTVDSPQPDQSAKKESHARPEPVVLPSRELVREAEPALPRPPAASASAEEEKIEALIRAKLANPHKHLSLDDGLAVLRQCTERGHANAQRIAGRTAIMVVGNTGAGKSTFLNYVVGCTMESKSRKAIGLKGVGEVVLVKPVSEGGSKDALVAIGHGKISETFLPNVLIDDETELCFCDCPGFLDNRGAEINIANAVNMITTLSAAKEVKIVILISYKSVEADRGRGLSELITVCTKLFGSVDKLTQHLGCVLIGCSLFQPDSTLEDLKETLVEDSPEIVSVLVERLFLIDVLADRDGWWSREECIERIRSLPVIANPAEVFHTVLLSSDEKKLIDMGMEMNRRVESSLVKGNYSSCHDLYRALEQLSVIKHVTVERIVRDCYLFICKYFMKEGALVKEHCHLSAFAEAEQVLQTLQAAAGVFQGEEWEEVLPLEQLRSFLVRAQERHTEQVRRHEALRLQLVQAGDQIDKLTAALEAQMQEALRKEKELTERFEEMRKELAEQLETSRAMFHASQKSLQEELTARLRAKDEETKLAIELRQQDVMERLAAEKQAIEEEYKRQLADSKRKYEKELMAQREKERMMVAAQEKAHEAVRMEREAAEKQERELREHKEKVSYVSDGSKEKLAAENLKSELQAERTLQLARLETEIAEKRRRELQDQNEMEQAELAAVKQAGESDRADKEAAENLFVELEKKLQRALSVAATAEDVAREAAEAHAVAETARAAQALSAATQTKALEDVHREKAEIERVHAKDLQEQREKEQALLAAAEAKVLEDVRREKAEAERVQAKELQEQRVREQALLAAAQAKAEEDILREKVEAGRRNVIKLQEQREREQALLPVPANDTRTVTKRPVLREMLHEVKLHRDTHRDTRGVTGVIRQQSAQHEQFELTTFAKLRTAEDFASGAFFGKAKVKEHFLSFQNTGIPKSLTLLSADQNSIALQIHQSLRGYMGDKQMPNPANLAHDILSIGYEHQSLRDEIYVQIIKQLTSNPLKESMAKGWQVMCMCVATFPPSNEFEPFLLHFITERRDRGGGAIPDYARYCLRELDSLLNGDVAVGMPSLEDVRAYKERPPILATISLVDGSIVTENLLVKPHLNVGAVIEICHQLLNLKDSRMNTLGMFVYDLGECNFKADHIPDKGAYIDLKRTPWPLRNEDYMGAAVVQKARQHRKFKFVLKRKIFLPKHNFYGEDPVFEKMTYLQAFDEVITLGNIDVPSLEDAVDLAAVAMTIACGSNMPANISDMIGRGVERFLPPTWRISKSPEEWAVLILQHRDDLIVRTIEDLQRRFLTIVQNLPFYGSHWFYVHKKEPLSWVGIPRTLQQLPYNLLLAINPEGVHIFDFNRRQLLTIPFCEIVRWTGNSSQLNLVLTGANSHTPMAFEFELITAQAVDIAAIVLDHIRAVLNQGSMLQCSLLGNNNNNNK